MIHLQSLHKDLFYTQFWVFLEHACLLPLNVSCLIRPSSSVMTSAEVTGVAVMQARQFNSYGAE